MANTVHSEEIYGLDYKAAFVPAERGRDWGYVWGQCRNGYMPDLPTDFDALVKVAGVHAREYDRAILYADPDMMLAAMAGFKACVIQANGGDPFASEDGPSAPGPRIRAALRAKPGEVPHWGQTGEFLVEHNGIKAVVCYSGLESFMGASLHAATKTGPFVSETGYRSLSGVQPIYGTSLDEAAAEWIDALLHKQPAVFINAKHRKDPTEEFPWLSPADMAAPEVFQDKGGQMAFLF